ncbi:MAG: cation transporter, partial [Myxococcales bacterium]|nr:cation transporter [Myxococcales bacterium]
MKPQDSHDVGDARASARSSTERALAVALLLNFVYLLVEVSAGLLSGSLALLSDAAHMVSDVAALAL